MLEDRQPGLRWRKSGSAVWEAAPNTLLPAPVLSFPSCILQPGSSPLKLPLPFPLANAVA